MSPQESNKTKLHMPKNHEFNNEKRPKESKNSIASRGHLGLLDETLRKGS